MEANINLKIDKDDLSYELKELVSEIASEEIRRMVKAVAEKMVRDEVQKVIQPIVDSYLETAQVGREHISYHDKGPSRGEVDKYIKRIIQDYLDEPAYLYSETSEKLSHKYAISSGHGNKTRAEMWVIDKSRKYVETELFGKMEESLQLIAKKILPSEEKINEIIQNRVIEIFA